MTSYQLLLPFAKQLFQMPVFHSRKNVRANSLYSIYTAVPLRDIYRGGIRIGDSDACLLSDAQCPTVDLLICKDDEILLAILFGENDAQRKNYFGLGGILSGIQSVNLPELQSAGPEWKSYFQAIAASFQTAVDISNRHLQCADFSLTVTPLQKIIPETYLPKLKTCNLIAADGTITESGHSCGIFQSIDEDEAPKYFISNHTIRTLMDYLFTAFAPPISSSIVPLQERLARANAGIPTDGQYAQYILSGLQKLVNTPLEEYYRLSPQAASEVKEEYDKLQSLIVDARRCFSEHPLLADLEQMSVQTFGDAILMADMLYEPPETVRHQGIDSENLSICLRILTSLGTPAVNGRSSTSTYNCSPLYQAFNMPIKNYIYGACMLQQSFYPSLVYQTELQEHVMACTCNDSLESACTPFDLMENALNMMYYPDPSTMSEALELLYNLLVSPLVKGPSHAHVTGGSYR